MKRIEVVAGVINRNGKVMIARRKFGKSMAGYWEFPGGKIEVDEGPENALKRELEEELGIIVVIRSHIIDVEHEYPEFTIILKAFNVEYNGQIKSSTDHDAFEWISPESFQNYNIAPADIPIFLELIG